MLRLNRNFYANDYIGQGTYIYTTFFSFTMDSTYTGSVPYDTDLSTIVPFSIDWNTLGIVEVAGVYTAGATIRRLNKTFIFNGTSNASYVPTIQAHNGMQTLSRYETTSASWAAGGNSATAGAFRIAIVSSIPYLRIYNSSSPAAGSSTQINIKITSLQA